jgi:transcriptional repressor NrdR
MPPEKVFADSPYSYIRWPYAFASARGRMFAMHCPVCRHDSTSVVDTRSGTDGDVIRRRRACDACGHRFSTLEEIHLLDLVVVKRDGKRESYDRDKLIRGLRKALEKRQHTDAEFRGLVHAVERDIQKEGETEITSGQIGNIVMRRLKDFDEVAYIRFASVYRQFEDVDSFQRELNILMRAGRKSRVTSHESRVPKKKRAR